MQLSSKLKFYNLKSIQTSKNIVYEKIITNPAEVALGLLPAIFFIIRSRFLRITSSVLSSFAGVGVDTVVGVEAAVLVLSDDIPVKK